MSVRTEIQNRITTLVKTGTFNKITYIDKIATDTGVGESPESIVCNELSGGLSNSSSSGATSFGYVLNNWRFECVADFTCEVDTSYFMLNELKNLNFSTDDVLVTVIPSGDFSVTHPPRKASHNGTKLIIGLTANTRR